jgi:hypothetical protein
MSVICAIQNITGVRVTIRGYQQAMIDIQNSGNFEREDFTVGVQPFSSTSNSRHKC